MPTKPTGKKRSRQTSPAAATFRIENEYNPETVPQYFQVAVNVLEARKLAWSNPQTASSFVVVVLGKKRRRTSVRRNMEEPYYREYFVFELYASVRDIERLNLRLAVMEVRCCANPRVLGQADIDMSSIWTQPYHQVFRKWAQLTQPADSTAGPVGFLKVDISIVYRGEVQYIPQTVINERFEENLLFPSGSEQQRANYVITIHSGFSLPNGSHCYGDSRYGKQPSTFVRVSYCGLVAKTAVQRNTSNPIYNEQISMVEMFPNMSQQIHLEVCIADGCFSRVLCGTRLRLDQISHDGENGFIPTFGPSLINMYGPTCGSTFAAVEDGPFHRGALLISLRTIVPYYQQGFRTINIEPAQPLTYDNIWCLEDFRVYCPILEISMLDRRVSGKVTGVAITMADVANNKKFDPEDKKLYYTGSLPVMKTKTDYGYINFPYAFPVLQLATRLPDFRFRMYRNNMVQGIYTNLNTAVTNIEHRLKSFEYESTMELTNTLDKALDDAAGNILKFLDIIKWSATPSNENVMQRDATELDRRQMSVQRDEIQKIYYLIGKKGRVLSNNSRLKFGSSRTKPERKNSRKYIKSSLAETKELLKCLENLIYTSSEGWPDIVIWLLNEGSRVAFTKVSASSIIYSLIPEQCGNQCGQIQTLYMKPLKCPKHMTTLATGCFCIAAKLEVCLWMGLYRQESIFSESIPAGYRLKIKNVDMCLKTKAVILECRCFIYRAKLNSGVDNSGLADPFVRMNVLNLAKDTQVKTQTLTPVWNQVLRIQKMVFCSRERLVATPPIILIEVYDRDFRGKYELIGRVPIQPVVDDREDYDYAPKLQWYEIYKGVEYTGQVLMSAQILQIPETLLKSTIYSSVEESYIAPQTISQRVEIEALPPNLIPKSTTYKLDVYWWGLRDVAITRKPCVVLEIDELQIKSNVILERKPNCNFPDGKTTHSFDAPLKEIYCPPISLKLYDSSTFGRTVFLGTNIVRNPNKYIVNWLPKQQREDSLRTSSVMSANVSKYVNQVMFVTNSTNSTSESDLMTAEKGQTKEMGKLLKMFWVKEKAEEKYTLLPVLKSRDKRHNGLYGVKHKEESEHEIDWWLRFFCSQKECVGEDRLTHKDKITLFTSELECQPGFTKFKDWCSTLKLYNGKKTGIPEKDERLYCGFLKAGIAIYRWPPPANTTAVSPSGVDLHKGFFDDHPSNDPTKYLVRVYIVKGFNLMPKDFSGKSDPYVVLNCGKKKIGDRKCYIPKTLNPIFGKMYEFRCTMPDDYLLSVTVYDYNVIPPDDIIGCTAIDLEDRIYTKHRATCGLSRQYIQTGPTKWRDCMRPSVVLEQLCAKNHLPPPVFPNADTVMINGVEYKDSAGNYNTAAERKENICLNILHNWKTLPICGYPLVTEHVETRTLFNPSKPGLDQGKLQMWVDIFPLDSGYAIPPALDITPRKLEEYELRVIIWDVEGVKLDDYDIMTGQRSSDIYVKSWIGRAELAQQTDIHYRSLTGVGNFNWRMVFKFDYLHAERKLIVRDTSIFTEVEEHMPPLLYVQVMDSDMISADDFLGSVSFNLNSMPRGAKTPRLATARHFEHAKKVNLFAIYSLRGWWPLKSHGEGAKESAGVIDLELTLLPKDRALMMPVGLGREPPHPLPPPNRPPSSFNLFQNPLLVLKAIFHRRGYKAIGSVICLVLVGAFFIIAYMDLPRILLERFIGRRN